MYCDLIAGAVLDGISAEMASSGADIGAREDLPAEVVAEVAPEAAPATA
jgi:small subunit ribosomal protein S2